MKKSAYAKSLEEKVFMCPGCKEEATRKQMQDSPNVMDVQICPFCNCWVSLRTHEIIKEGKDG